MKALIIGATGATGKDLVEVLLQDVDYSEVVVFVRRTGGIKHPKLIEVLTDFDKLEEISRKINGDVLFSCLGTTLKAAGSKDKQKHIDYEIPLKFAEIARIQGVKAIVLLSAYGASAKSRVFYSRIKGKLEEDTIRLAFDPCIIFKPGMLLRKNTDRAGERITGSILHFLNRFGIIRKFRPLSTEILSQKMALASKVFKTGNHTIELEKIWQL